MLDTQVPTSMGSLRALGPHGHRWQIDVAERTELQP